MIRAQQLSHLDLLGTRPGNVGIASDCVKQHVEDIRSCPVCPRSKELPSFLKVGGCSARTIGAFFGKVPCLAVTALLGIAVLLATQGQKARRRLTRKRSATSRHDPG